MTRWTAFFLILLRLAIGWHFLFEGVQKVQSVHVGPTVTNRPFSSAGYFREAPGPLGGWYRQLEGDPDDRLLARLAVPPPPPGEDPATARPYLRMPEALRAEYDNYLTRFTAHYALNDDQKKLIEPVQQQAESDVVAWLTYVAPSDPKKREADKLYPKMVSEQVRKFPTGEVKRVMTMPERIAEYRAKLAEVRDTAENKLWALGKDVEGPRLRQARTELASLRSSLNADLDDRAAEFHKALADKAGLTAEQKAKGPVPPRQEQDVVGWIDWATRWGLTAMGACLLVGLFTRLNCLAAATFLAMTYLAFPALPWLPAPPANEGNYLFVNKNVVEMLALLALATTASGRWFGLDAVLHRLLWGADKPQDR